jgi:glycosyltransferase involved in cell wall biosynthesis
MRVLIVQHSLKPPGGGNAVAAWMVHALAGQHEVGTLTASRWSVGDTNAFYGTTIPDRAVTRYVVPTPWQWLSGLQEDSLTRLRMCSVLRSARTLASQYDVLVTADNFAPFPKPGIQYVHFPADLKPKPARLAPLVNVYFTLCDTLLGARWTDAAKNLTLANSRWTAERLERIGEVGVSSVLYPPVLDPGEGRGWAERDDAFLCVGRFHESKRIELAISIVRRIRSTTLPRARLLIAGSSVDARYTSELQRLAAADRDWIEFREDLSRQDLNALMGRARYGIQGMIGEHFGMATAEMTRAGCLVFAHDSGGTPEVLNQERTLLWSTEDEAVTRIASVAAEPVEALRARLREHADQFSTGRFVEQFRQIVETAAGRSVSV